MYLAYDSNLPRQVDATRSIRALLWFPTIPGSLVGFSLSKARRGFIGKPFADPRQWQAKNRASIVMNDQLAVAQDKRDSKSWVRSAAQLGSTRACYSCAPIRGCGHAAGDRELRASGAVPDSVAKFTLSAFPLAHQVREISHILHVGIAHGLGGSGCVIM